MYYPVSHYYLPPPLSPQPSSFLHCGSVSCFHVKDFRYITLFFLLSFSLLSGRFAEKGIHSSAVVTRAGRFSVNRSQQLQLQIPNSLSVVERQFSLLCHHSLPLRVCLSVSSLPSVFPASSRVMNFVERKGNQGR